MGMLLYYHIKIHNIYKKLIFIDIDNKKILFLKITRIYTNFDGLESKYLGIFLRNRGQMIAQS